MMLQDQEKPHSSTSPRPDFKEAKVFRDEIWEQGFQVNTGKHGLQVEITTEFGIGVIPWRHFKKRRLFRTFGFQTVQSAMGTLITLQAAFSHSATFQAVTVTEKQFKEMQTALENKMKSEPQVKNKKSLLLKLQEQMNFIQYGSRRKYKFLDPLAYESRTLSQLVIRTREYAQAMKRHPEWRNYDQLLIRAACLAVHEVLPYKLEILDGHKHTVAADFAKSLTTMVRLKEGGVCRHQGPILAALLRKLGYTTYLIWNDFIEDPQSSHALCYIVNIKCFSHPGVPNSEATIVPFSKYKTLFGKTPTNFRYRMSNGSWKKLNWKY